MIISEMVFSSRTEAKTHDFNSYYLKSAGVRTLYRNPWKVNASICFKCKVCFFHLKIYKFSGDNT